MAMTKQKAMTEQEMWTALFPMNATSNYLSSKLFIKKLTLISVSAITYMRDLFPETSYTQQQFAGVNLRILKEKSRSNLANFLSSALNNALEALDNKYLHQLALCFYKDEQHPETLLESYIFTFTYNDKHTSISIENKGRNTSSMLFECSVGEIEQQTRQLIRTCMVMIEGNNLLPEEYEISFRLYYYDDTPIDYHPNGFVADEREDHLLKYNRTMLKVGKVMTPYHKFAMNVYSKDLCSVEDGFRENEVLNQTMDVAHTPLPGTSPDQLSDSALKSKLSESSLNDYDIRCVCNRNNPPDYFIQPLLIICSNCKTAQHAVCYGLQENDEDQHQVHCCEICSVENTELECTDPKLLIMARPQREGLCLYRRTLSWCQQVNTMDAHTLMEGFSISAKLASKLINRLEIDGVLKPLPEGTQAELRTARKIDPNTLKNNIIPKYFWRKPCDSERSLGENLLNQFLLTPEQPIEEINQMLKENVTLKSKNPHKNESRCNSELMKTFDNDQNFNTDNVKKGGKVDRCTRSMKRGAENLEPVVIIEKKACGYTRGKKARRV